MFLKIAKFGVENKKNLTMEGEVFFQDAEVEFSKVDDVILDAMVLVSRLKVEVLAFDMQLEGMKLMGGISFWPKPMLHPCMSHNFVNSLTMNPCGYYYRGYECTDIAFTSCKHAYHPFCFVQVIKAFNHYLVCNSMLHLNWCSSWGFQAQDAKMQAFDEKLNLENM